MRSSVKLTAPLVVLLFIIPFAASAADFNKGFAAYKKGDWDLALKELEPAAVAGNFNAQFLLAELYLRGDGKEQDFERAFHWYGILYDRYEDLMSADNLFKYAHSLELRCSSGE